jgi:hypothetical protein
MTAHPTSGAAPLTTDELTSLVARAIRRSRGPDNAQQSAHRSLRPIDVPGGPLQRRWITAARHAHLWRLPLCEAAVSFDLEAEQVLRAWRVVYPGEAVPA